MALMLVPGYVSGQMGNSPTVRLKTYRMWLPDADGGALSAACLT